MRTFVQRYDLENNQGERRTEYGVKLLKGFATEGEAKKYAKLLDAAPELLECLKKSRDYILSYAEHFDCAETRQYLAEVQSLIGKAEGTNNE